MCQRSCVGPNPQGWSMSSVTHPETFASADPASAGVAVVGHQKIGIWSESVLAGHAVVALSDRASRWLWLGQHPHAINVGSALRAAVVVWDHVTVGSAHIADMQVVGGVPEHLVLMGPGARDVARSQPGLLEAWCWEPGDGVDRLKALLADLVRLGEGSPELSVQESRVLQLCAEGLKVSAVARRLALSPHTVHTYLRRIRRKFADHGRPVASQLELYRAASDWGLLDAERSVG